MPCGLRSDLQLRSANSDDAALILEMARHPSVIENWPLPDIGSDEVRSFLPAAGEVSIAAAGVGGALLDALFAHCVGTVNALCAHVHARNPAQKRYQRRGFEVIGQGRGPVVRV